jgi:hypothetical protein
MRDKPQNCTYYAKRKKGERERERVTLKIGSVMTRWRKYKRIDFMSENNKYQS